MNSLWNLRIEGLSLRLSRASFEEEKNLEDFDFSFNINLNSRLIRDLAVCFFIEKREHVLLYSPAGTRKSNILQTLKGIWALGSSE